MSLAAWLRDSLRIRRLEFMVAEVPILVLPVLVSSRDRAVFSSAIFWEATAAFFLMFHFGDLINCLADRDLDAADKPHLSRAVYGLGLRAVRWQIGLSAAAALALSAHLAWVLSRPRLLGLTAIGLGLGAAYSVEPVRFKRRGLAQVGCLWLIIFVGPMLFIEAAVREHMSLPFALFAAAYATIQMGVILVNTAEDLPEDRAAGVRTSIVALGLEPGLTLAVTMVALGGAGLVASFVHLYRPRGFPEAWELMLAAPVLGGVVALVGVERLRRAASTLREAEAVAILKSGRALVPVLLTLVAWTSFAAALPLYFRTAP